MCWEKKFAARVGVSEVWWAQAALGAPLDPGPSQLLLLQWVWLTLLGAAAAGSSCFHTR